jgi:ATP-dependent Clp protease adapter protein ClpS
MILELVEEINPGTGTMYAVAKDGKGVKWFATKEFAEAYYNEVLANPDILKPQRNILKSEEIDVPLEEQNN